MPSRLLSIVLALGLGVCASAQSTLESLDAELRGLQATLAARVVALELEGSFQLDPRFEAEVWRMRVSGVVLDSAGAVLSHGRAFLEATAITVHADGAALPASLRGVDRATGLALLDVPGLAGHAWGLADAAEVPSPGALVAVCGGAEGGAFSLSTLRGRATIERGERSLDDALVLNLDLAVQDAGGLVSDVRGRPIGIAVRGYREKGDERLGPGDLLGQLFREERMPEALMPAAASGRSYALALPTVHAAVERIRSQHTVRRGWIGISAQTLDEDAATALGVVSALRVRMIFPDGPAERSELALGDVIVGIVSPAAELEELAEVVRSHPGETIELRVIRDGSFLHINVKIGERFERVHSPQED